MELTARARAMQEFSFQVFEAFTAATVIYIVINIIVTFAMRYVEQRVAVPDLSAPSPQSPRTEASDVLEFRRRRHHPRAAVPVLRRHDVHVDADRVRDHGGVIFGTLLAMMRLSGIAPLSLFAAGYVNLMRSVPLLLVIFWFYFLCPISANGSPAPRDRPSGRVPLLVHHLHTVRGGVFAEIMRAGIQSIPRGRSARRRRSA